MEQEEELHSFPYEATIGGRKHTYRITQDNDKYGVEQDGLVIAEIRHDEQWRQIGGEPLRKDLLQSICDHIEAHYG